MNALIPLRQAEFSGEQKQTVNARDLHEFLENGDKFTTWMKERINQFGFIENQDFVSYSANAEKPQGGRPSIDYFLSLDMAKELSMVERNEKGKQARQYFIQCEKNLKAASSVALPADPRKLMALALIEAQKVIEEKDEQLAIAKPKAAALERISKADGSLCITSAAKDLQVRPKDLFLWLTSHKWIYRRMGSSTWIGYQEKIQTGYLEHKITTYSTSDGTEKITEQVRITSKGMARISELLEKEAA